jgi:hypothetical protein
MNSRAFAMTLLAMLAITQTPANAGEIHFIPLNDPNQAQGGTGSHAINDLGVTTGYYYGADGLGHGFVSTPPYSNRSFTTVEVSGALFINTFGINLEGAVTGYSLDTSDVWHGFVSHPPYTTVTAFDAPGACSSDTNPACAFLGTFPYSNNLEGVIAGYYVDANGVSHGFVTHRPYTASTFTTIDAPGACSSGTSCAGLGTNMYYNILNDFGVVTGYYFDASAVAHGFVSSPPYTRFTSFDAPGACSSDISSCAFNGTEPASINLFGVITGTYYDAHGVGHGFVTHPPYTKTTFTSFDAPSACSSGTACSGLGTYSVAINAEGVVVGNDIDASGVNHGFLSRPPYTTVTTFDAPYACSSGTSCAGLGTLAISINVEGVFTGFAYDASGDRHSFVAYQ